MERRILAARWRQLVLVLVPLGIVHVTLALDAARGGTPVAVASAALVAGAGVFGAFDDAPRATINAITCIQAFHRVRAELAGRPIPHSLAAPPPDRPPLIRFEGVCFRYPGTVFERYLTRARDLARRTGAITVVVSHRFSTVTGADHILVLHHGRLVEQGSHEDLLAADGRYANLYRIQSTAYAN